MRELSLLTAAKIQNQQYPTGDHDEMTDKCKVHLSPALSRVSECIINVNDRTVLSLGYTKRCLCCFGQQCGQPKGMVATQSDWSTDYITSVQQAWSL